MRIPALVAGLTLLFPLAPSASASTLTTAGPVVIKASAVGDSAVVIDAAGEKIGVVWQVGTAGNISQLCFQTNNVITGDTVTFSLQDVNASGQPDGVQDQTIAVVVDASDDNTWKCGTLGSDRAVGVGDFVAAVIDYPAYVAGNMSWRMRGLAGSRLSYHMLYTASWARLGAPLMVALYDDGAARYQSGLNAGSSGTSTYQVNSTPDEIGVLYTPEVSQSVCGFVYNGTLAGNATGRLYDTDGSTVLASAAIAAGLYVGSSAGDIEIALASADLVGGSSYRLTLLPTTTTSVTLNTIAYRAAGDRAQEPYGASMYQTSRADAGAWTEDTLTRPRIYPIVCKIHDGLRVPTVDGGFVR